MVFIQHFEVICRELGNLQFVFRRFWNDPCPKIPGAGQGLEGLASLSKSYRGFCYYEKRKVGIKMFEVGETASLTYTFRLSRWHNALE